jgi:trigger factor
MQTSVTELPESRVRVDVDVEAGAVDSAVEKAAARMGGEMRIPGFRKGKVPGALVVQRVGRDAILEQAVRDSLGEWYEAALIDTKLNTVGDPKLDVSELPAEGEDLRFTIEIAVRPEAKLGDYKGLEVGRAPADVPDEAIDAEVDRLREAFASVNPVDRDAADGDMVVVDYAGTIDGELFDGGSANDQMIEVGAGRLLPEMEEAVRGAAPGAELDVELAFPEDYGAEDLAGKTAQFALTIKEVREKKLPDLDDEFASNASEFDTLDELRAQISERLGEVIAQRSEAEFRDAAVQAAADAATVELPEEIVNARAEEMLDRFLHQLSHRGVEPEAFVGMQENGREGMLAEMGDDATKSLRREATLAAIAEAESIEASDEELIEALGPGEGDSAPAKILERLRERGRDELLREEVRMRKAADVIVENAKAIPLEQAKAREEIWTPEKESTSEETGEKLWTPDSD